MVQAKTLLVVPEADYLTPLLPDYVVVQAASGSEAARILEARTDIDLVVLGLDLAGEIDGFETARRIRALHDVPIVFLSARRDAASVEDARKISKSGYVPESAREFLLEPALTDAFERDSRQKSETTFRQIVEAFPVPMALNDQEQRILYLNPAFVSTFGYDLSDIPTLSHWWPLAYPDPAYREWVAYTWGVRLQRGQKENKPFEPFEVVIRCKDGSERTVIGSAIHAEEHGVHPVLLYDITDRKKAEAALAREKELLRVTLQSIADAVVTTDIAGRVMGMNEAAELLTEWKEDESLGQDIDTIFQISSEHGGVVPSPVASVLLSNRTVQGEGALLLKSRNQNTRLVAQSAAPIRDASGKTVGVVLVFRDVTEREKLLENMQRTDKLDSLGVLAGGIAHDFNNMLASLFGYIELAREHSAELMARNFLDRALMAFHRARDLTQQLLTFSRGGAPAVQPGRLDSLVLETAAFILSGSNVACRSELPPDLWACDFDPGQMTQVFSNLIINAQQAMPHGGKITITGRNRVIEKEGPVPPGRYVEVQVADGGPGIPAEHIARIFDPFFSTRAGGSGLGLATCYSILKKHQGFIDVTSTGLGATFRILLPASTAEPAPPASGSLSLRHGSGRILIMDDEELLRDAAGALLSGMGYTVTASANGEEALKLAREAALASDPFVAAILDLTVPGAMGGKEAAAILKEHSPSMLLFATSGYSEDPVMSDPGAYGFAGSLQKPYRAAELGTMLSRCLSEHVNNRAAFSPGVPES